MAWKVPPTLNKATALSPTLTSAACPVTDLIVEEVEHELDRVLPPDCLIEVELCWEPPWTPAMMSERARRFMQW